MTGRRRESCNQDSTHNDVEIRVGRRALDGNRSGSKDFGDE